MLELKHNFIFEGQPVAWGKVQSLVLIHGTPFSSGIESLLTELDGPVSLLWGEHNEQQ
ncbi:hydrolase [Pectobacterium brasiliense]|uniref:Hydrolase n=1 Tax=Pectobacterium brasiliense TaxID=180957 RepID=A0AAW9H0D1_9GAMM|nr:MULTISPECIES: hydrolase [Pectobacterium]MDY4377501.1 hydrolase [Pectobacterium brasiliense]PXB03367.1 hydrolase [Pectobacterium carotovorum subsp. carotovorum]